MLVSERARSEVAASVSTAIARVDGLEEEEKRSWFLQGFGKGGAGRRVLRRRKKEASRSPTFALTSRLILAVKLCGSNSTMGLIVAVWLAARYSVYLSLLLLFPFYTHTSSRKLKYFKFTHFLLYYSLFPRHKKYKPGEYSAFFYIDNKVLLSKLCT